MVKKLLLVLFFLRDVVALSFGSASGLGFAIAIALAWILLLLLALVFATLSEGVHRYLRLFRILQLFLLVVDLILPRPMYQCQRLQPFF